MKFLFALILLPTLSFGATRFLPNSNLSLSMQEFVAKMIDRKSTGVEKNWTFVETRTIVRKEKVDQQIYDSFYYTTFNVLGSDSDGYHPRQYTLMVESSEFAFQNGENRAVTFMHADYIGHNYSCIADRLQAINSDYYYNLSAKEISEMLFDPGFAGHETVVEETKLCDKNL